LEAYQHSTQSLKIETAFTRNLAIVLAVVVAVLSFIVSVRYIPDFLPVEAQTSTAGPSNYRVVDMQAFSASIGNRLLYTCDRLEHADRQLEKAPSGREFEIIDCYGHIHTGVPKPG
jgi:hypothetical protein